jgi:hypothetical protein
MNARAVERISAPSYETFAREGLRANVPLLIADAMSSWPAMHRFSLEHLGEIFGDDRIAPVTLAQGQFHIDEALGVRVQETDYATYRAHIEASDAPELYLRQPFDDESPLARDVRIPVYCKKRVVLKRNVWVGGRGTASDLHFDMTHNIVAQVVGRRRVVLYPKSESENLYPYPLRTLNWHHSRVRLEAPDLDCFPRFAQARPLCTELRAGEMLFIPQGYWHRFETLETSIAVNFFWLTKRHVPAMALARLLWITRGVRT